jgi:hypothetical protein
MCLRKPRGFAFKTHINRNFIIFGFENDKPIALFGQSVLFYVLLFGHNYFYALFYIFFASKMRCTISK